MVWYRRKAALAATCCIIAVFGMISAVIAQEAPAVKEDHAHGHMTVWQVMQDGIVFRRIQPARQSKRRKRVRRAELVDGHGGP